MNFEAYLNSKKIDSRAFFSAEPELWQSLEAEFDQLSPSSFTAQKLYLINPIRRKYQLKADEPLNNLESVHGEQPHKSPANAALESTVSATPIVAAKPTVARPVMRPKPKMN